jgi:thiol-disulfide isomerase/thioredoxin
MFEAGVSYERYIELTLNEKVKDRMTGHWQAAEELINNLDPQKLNQLNRKLKVLCIGENWCGDCANGIPVIARLAESLDNWEFVIAPKTPFEEDFPQFYSTAGRQKIPVIVFADEDGDEISRWVERPTRSYRLLADLQAQKLPKEEYMAKYKSMPELKVPSLTGEILKELIEAADRATAMTQILPTKRRQ